MCEMCGNVLKCPHCDISYTYHKTKDILRCHYCGMAISMPKECPYCHTKTLKELGTGTEKTENGRTYYEYECSTCHNKVSSMIKFNTYTVEAGSFADGKI